MTSVIEARDVYRFHEIEGRRIPILKGVTFSLSKGKFSTVMGPSGSGKSTLLHILAGLDLPSAGEVIIGDQPISTASEEQRTKIRRTQIGFIFQFFQLLPDLTVEENIVLPLLIAGESPPEHAGRVEELMNLLSIGELRSRQPRGLSGGEMQRVSIARALVTNPPLLMADEPTGNLSSKAGQEIVALLKDVARQYEATVLLVTHNPRDAAAGEEVMFLHDGSLDSSQSLTGGNFDAADVFRRLEELGI